MCRNGMLDASGLERWLGVDNMFDNDFSLARHLEQALFIGRRGDAGHRADLRVAEDAAAQGAVDRGEHSERACDANLLARGPGIDVRSPGEPVSAAGAALPMPEAVGVEVADQDELPMGSRVLMRLELRELALGVVGPNDLFGFREHETS